MDELTETRGRVVEWIKWFNHEEFTNIDDAVMGVRGAFAEFSVTITREHWGSLDHALDLLALLDVFCTIYLNASPGERSEIRSLVYKDHGVLWWVYRYHGTAGSKLRGERDPKWLEKSLAALSIVDQGVDFREVYFALGGLYLVAKEVGIEPEPYFRAVGAISSSIVRPYTSGLSTKDLLMTFHESPFFEETVQPKLR